MQLNAPKQMYFYIAVALAVIALLGVIVQIPFVTGYAFWLLLLGFVVLTVGVMVPGV